MTELNGSIYSNPLGDDPYKVKDETRSRLEDLLGQEIRVCAEFSEYRETNQKRQVALLVNINDETGVELTDHIWIPRSKVMKKLALQRGDKVSFTAQVTQYVKGSTVRGWMKSFGFKGIRNFIKQE